jgi:hypothetical protein
MADVIPEDERSNYETFRDCLSEPVLKALAMPTEKPKSKRKRHAKKTSKQKNGTYAKVEVETPTTASTNTSDAEDLADFIDVRPSPKSHSNPPLTLPSTSAP